MALWSHGAPPGESPPPPPRACFGRDELIERIVGLAETLTPIALIGAGGIGKTAIALTVLHHDRIKERFGDNRRFIRCDQFNASRTNFLNRLSKAIGARVNNPEDLTPLRTFLSSTGMILVLDNAESILDPQETHAQEIYDIVEELGHFSNICLCITSRISTIPPDYKTLDIPTLSMEAAHNAFYRIYENNENPDLVDNILEQLDFHPLSVTLLATAAHHNRWDSSRLAREWEQHRTGMLQIGHNRSLAATIELSLASPMFQDLGPSARGFLGVIAFFPQGVNENSINWLSPTRKIFNWSPPTPPRLDIFDKFCILSLTYRSNGFVTMLAPLRDYLCPKDPKLSPLLCMAKKYYFNQLSVGVGPNNISFEEGQWITSEDVNVEHLFDVFTSINANSCHVWTASQNFMRHLYWHKPRPIVLGPKIEGLPDNHHSKPLCLFRLARLFESVGNHLECKRLLTHMLGLWRKQRIWNLWWVAMALNSLSSVNATLGFHAEGIQQAQLALKIYKWDLNRLGQARALRTLARSLKLDGQLDAAQKAVSQSINLYPDKGRELDTCQCYALLGEIHQSKGETDTAFIHFETALRIISPCNCLSQQSHIHQCLAELFSRQDKFNEAHAHIEHAKSYAMNDNWNLGQTIYLQAGILCKEQRFREAKSEVLHAITMFEKLGAAREVDDCKILLNDIEEKINGQVTTGGPDSSGEFLASVQLPLTVNSSSTGGPSTSN